MSRTADHRSEEAGEGLLAGVFGVGIIVGMLLFACQLLAILYANSELNAAASWAVETAAAAPYRASQAGIWAADTALRRFLGSNFSRATLQWSTEGSLLMLSISEPAPQIFPPLAQLVEGGRIKSSVTAPIEAP